MDKDRGSASVEIMAMAPLAALLIVVALQLSQLFSHAVADVAGADAKAARAVRAWDAANSWSGFHRPCLEEMPEISFSSGGGPLAIGVGPFVRYAAVPQEVRVVAEPVCSH